MGFGSSLYLPAGIDRLILPVHWDRVQKWVVAPWDPHILFTN
jgi:hypothetical protein